MTPGPVSQPRTALVAVRSFLQRDPRVRRQVEWLTARGWSVDTLALGDGIPGSRDHFEIAPQAAWSTSRIGRGLMHLLLPDRAKFRVMATSRFPRAVTDRLRRGDYELVVLNDIDFLPWVDDARLFPPGGVHVHADLHEYFPPRLPPGSRLRLRVDSHHQWIRRHIGAPRIDTRSVVSGSIADAYAAELGIARPGIVRSAPALADLVPSPVEPERVRLVHHGAASRTRGLERIIDAVRLLDDRFELTFMLVGSDEVAHELRQHAADLGDRVRFADPVPTPRIAQEINRFDLEVMFFPPVTRNLEWVLPNKLFEAVQARLGLVIGPSVEMVAVVEQYRNGVVAAGWSAEELAATLAALSADRISGLKAASHAAARELNAAHEGEAFLAIIGASDASH